MSDPSATSPHTGMTRAHWAEFADRLLLGVRPYASPDHARIRLPGPVSASGEASDQLEAFARTFLTAGFRLAGERGEDSLDLAGWYAVGLAAGTDPDNPDRWPRPDEAPQARVEAASIALVLAITRPWVWDRLDQRVQANVTDWLHSAEGQWYPDNNWHWFRIVTASFVTSVGGTWDRAELQESFDLHESCFRGQGWYSDGPGRDFDHYAGWAWQFYPLLWADLFPDQVPALASEATVARWRGRLADYVDDALLLVGGDGSPLIQGRSLIYRFAAAAPLWMGAYTGATRAPPGLIRRACSGMLGHFLARGVPAEGDLLTIGWHHEFVPMRQTYSGFGSPYWASMGLFGLALPAEHPVWTEVEEPLPVEAGDSLRAMAAPGWLVSATAADGVVRVINHGTDHATDGAAGADSPLYARLGYSTATAPPVGFETSLRPADNSVVLLDRARRASHRTGFTTLQCHVEDGTGIAASRGTVHWVDAEPPARDPGSGLAGQLTPGPELTVCSLVRGSVEVRAVWVADIADISAIELSGWPLVGTEEATTRDGTVRIEHQGLISSLSSRHPQLRSRCTRQHSTSFLGDPVAVPVLTADLGGRGELCAAVVVALGDETVQASAAATRTHITAASVVVEWADGGRSEWRNPPHHG